MRLSRSAVLVTLVALASPVAADIAVTDATGKPLPAGLKARGAKIERIRSFADKLGTNYIVFSSTDSEQPGPDGFGPAQTRWLYIDHWAIAAGKKPKSLLPARDFEKDCPFDLTARFIDGAFGVSDLDGDGIAEVTYGYQLACRSDVSPATYKVLLVENGKKHILRGTSKIDMVDIQMGGDFTPEPVAAKWPKAFYAHATTLWKATGADAVIQ